MKNFYDQLLHEANEVMAPSDLVKNMFIDSLTGVYNRNAFNRAKFNSIAIADLDSLKYINDNFDHREGDRYLQKLAQTLVNGFDDQSVFRLGGDEFAVISSRSCTDVFRVLKDLRSCSFPGFSFGVANDLVEADHHLIVQKQRREVEGTRAPTGSRPPWLS